MIEKLKEELSNRKAFSTPIPEIFLNLAKTIPSDNIPDKMKLSIAVSEFILFAGQFRRNIKHWNESLIPINAISFVISESGSGKDSSVNTMRKNFQDGYNLIEEIREKKAIEKAIQKSKDNNLAKPYDRDTYIKFYHKPTPLFVSPSTPEGFVQHLNELDKDTIGSTVVYSGEIGGELENSPVIIGMFQLLSELYDEGKKEAKMLKNKEAQSDEVKNLPVNGFFVGTKDQILYDESIKKKFRVEFSSKLARRSFFCFNSEPLPQTEYNSTSELLKDQRAKEDKAVEIMVWINEQVKDITENQLAKVSTPITVSSGARDLFILYKNYNEALSNTIPMYLPISRLCRRHLQWKALKLAGAIAIWKQEEEISEQSYKEAMAYTELLSPDMEKFEIEINKEGYEVFASLANELASNEEHKYFFTIHQLRKLGYVVGAGIEKKMQELAQLANSYDTGGTYIAGAKGIEFTKIVKTDQIGVSFMECLGTKDERAKKCAKGYKYYNTTFAKLGDMLKKDCAYSPFEFKEGVRGNQNIISGTKWLALDVDHSVYTDEQMHYILQNINHHIVRTSNPENPKKFRILVELDAPIDLDDKVYKAFIKLVAQELVLDIDVLPRSQICYGYANRKILSVVDKEPFEIRSILLKAQSDTTPIHTVREQIANLSQAQVKALIDDPYGTFIYAYRAEQGTGSLSLIRAAKHAKDLGMNNEAIIALIRDINNYWEDPMDETRLNNTIIKQIEGW